MATTRGAATAPGSNRGPSLVEQELVNSLGWLISLRWVAGAMVLVASLVASAFRVPVPVTGLTSAGLAILGYNALLRWGLRLMRSSKPGATERFERFGRLQIGLDWAAMAVLIAQSGGAESPAIVFFLFHITIASLLLPHHLGFFYVSLAPALVAGVALLEYFGVLPHVAVLQPVRFRDPLFVSASVGFFAVACYTMAYLCMSIARRLRRRERELGGLYDSVRDITSSLDIDGVLDRIAEAAARTLGCQAAAIRLVDATRSQVEFAASWGLSETYRDEVPNEYARSVLDRDTLRERVVHVPNIEADPRVTRPDLARREGISSMLSVPILGRTGPLGVLRAYGEEGHRFTTEDAAYLQAVAAHGAVAIENAKAYRLLADLDLEKSRFLRMTTHELRSPVRVTESLLSTLREAAAGQLGPESRELLERAEKRLRSLHELIDDLLDLAAGKADLKVDRERIIDLRGPANEVVERFRPLAAARGLALNLALPPQAAEVWCDPTDLERVVGNLVGNAVKYTQRGEIDVAVEADAESVRLAVRDTGIGVPEDSLPHLFKEFFRAGNAKAAGESGTGLGLAIVRLLAERYGGEAAVASREGEGSTFTVTFPRAGRSPRDPHTER